MSERERSSCTPREPFVKLGAGQAPVLNYNIPQESCLTAHGAIPLRIPREWFVDTTHQEPPGHWWAIPRPVDLSVSLLEDVAFGKVTTPLIDSRVQQLLEALSPPPAPLAEAPPTARTMQPVAAARTLPRASIRAKPRRMRLSSRTTLQLDAVAKNMVAGLRPVAVSTLAGTQTLHFLPQPAAPVPRLYLVEIYKICSYLGDYGAGKTLSTFSLLPGEKTHISVRTYRDVTETSSLSENILDSFSESSATELETLVEAEMGASQSSSTTTSASMSSGGSVGVGVDILIVELGASAEAEMEGSVSTETAREETVSILNRAVEKHVEESSYTREVEVNTSATSSVAEGWEQSTVRELSNINHSRVLNFVCRQLLQQYITVTYLADVRVLYTNGYLEANRLMELYTLDDVLPKLIRPDRLREVKARILAPYCAVFNHRGVPFRFLDKVQLTVDNCEFLPKPRTITFYRKDPRLTDSVEGITVPGVITRVQRHTLRTPAVVVEALLGQGEALDCYNQELQSAAADRADLENKQQRIALEIIGAFPTPAERLDAYTRIFVPAEEEEAEDEEEAGS